MDTVDGFISDGGEIRAQTLAPLRLEQVLNRVEHGIVTTDDDADSLVHDALAVILFVREGPAVATNNNRQPFDDRLADTPRSGLADEEVCKLHVERHLTGEALDEHGNMARHRRDLPPRLLVAPTEENQLGAGVRTIELPRDLDHFHRAFAAKEDKSRRQVGAESELSECRMRTLSSTRMPVIVLLPASHRIFTLTCFL